MNQPIKIIVASKNPVKVNAAKVAFQKTFPTATLEVIGISVPSQVADQPMTDEETYKGAVNRANNAKKEMPTADYWVGIEGGIEDRTTVMDAFGWMVILSKEAMSDARSCSFPLPPYVAAAVRAGKELGHVNDAFFKIHNSKQGGGAVGSLTDNLVTRTDLYVQPMLLALIPFCKQELWREALLS